MFIVVRQLFCEKTSGQIKLLLLLFAFYQPVNAQKTIANPFAAIDKKVFAMPDSSNQTVAGISNYINANFTANKDKARAAFIWVASNIQYDIENMFAINFYATEDEKITKALTTKKGICENYAALFQAITTSCGLRSFVIDGYTKQNGFTDYIPHAWCAAFVDSAWFMFDATWGSGYVENGKFVKRLNNNYFMVKPEALIKSHMPFDYMWQFLNYPVTNQEFYDGKTMQNTSKPYFNFNDSINVFEKKNHIAQLNDEARRIQDNGVKNAMIFNELQNIKLQSENEKISAENERQSKIAITYNTAAAQFNDAVTNLNGFIEYRNHQFTPEKTDAALQEMIDVVNREVDSSKHNMQQIQNADANVLVLITQLNKAIEDFETHIKEQQDWLTTYLSKPKAKRKAMFYEKKISWYGVKLN